MRVSPTPLLACSASSSCNVRDGKLSRPTEEKEEKLLCLREVDRFRYHCTYRRNDGDNSCIAWFPSVQEVSRPISNRTFRLLWGISKITQFLPLRKEVAVFYAPRYVCRTIMSLLWYCRVRRRWQYVIFNERYDRPVTNAWFLFLWICRSKDCHFFSL